MISRDRAGAYADGSRQGAPDAVQVADRYHLLANVGEALERVLGSQRPALEAAAAAVDRLSQPSDRSDDEIPAAAEPVPSAPRQPEQRPQRGERLARYQAVLALHQQGWSQSAISRHLSRHLSRERKTIRRYQRANGFPERARPAARLSILAPYHAYLRSRWIAGCHNAHTLWQEIREQGFPGGDAIVRRYLATWRTRPARQGCAAHRASAEEPGCPPAPQRTRVLSPRQARWLLLRTWEELRPEEQSDRTELLDGYPAIREAQRLAEDFGHLVRQRDRSARDPWLARAKASALPEFRSFAGGVCRDRPAVEAALTLEWSNGATEGHINRLKYLKRQMFGRAGFALLRQRVLRAG